MDSPFLGFTRLDIQGAKDRAKPKVAKRYAAHGAFALLRVLGAKIAERDVIGPRERGLTKVRSYG